MGRWKSRKKYAAVSDKNSNKVQFKLTNVLKRQMVVTVLSIVGVMLLIVGNTYAIFSSVNEATNYNVVKAGTLTIAYDDKSSDILSLNGAYPQTDAEGQAGKGYKFTIKNTGTLATDYSVKILDDQGMIDVDKCSNNLLSKSFIRYSINGGTPNTLAAQGSDYVVATGTIQPNQTITYTIKMWISDNSDNSVLGKHYHGKVVVVGEQGTLLYSDDSGANTPELVTGMVPVTYNGTNWVVADTTKEWYDYDKQQWANAVTVNDATLRTAAPGTTVPMDKIDTMWVWIPRFSYTIKAEDGTNYFGKALPELGGTNPATSATPGAIDIKFVSSDIRETGSAHYTGNTATNYYTHPAFCFGDTCQTNRSDSGNLELNGIWYAKFESALPNGYEPNGQQGCVSNMNVANCNTLNNNFLVIKPSRLSWRYISLSTAFEVGKQLTTSSSYASQYGLVANTYDAHISRNTEWGAITYLSQSIYGKYGNPDYTGANKEIYANAHYSNVTGFSTGMPNIDGSTDRDTIIYDKMGDGTGASTTGTIYGVYDMSAGTFEYVMGYTGSLAESGFTTLPPQKYYDFYNNKDQYGNLIGLKGDASSKDELTFNEQDYSWYGEYVSISSGSWLVRGANNTAPMTFPGPFTLTTNTGGANGDTTFRLALIPMQ